MAGARIIVQPRLKTLRRRLDKAARPQLLAAWTEIGEIVHNSVMRNFDEEGRPQRWPPRKRETPETAGRKILQRTNKLRSSISTRPSHNGVQVGTNVHYGATHQLGDQKRNIPARPYLLVQREDEPEMAAVLERAIKGRL